MRQNGSGLRKLQGIVILLLICVLLSSCGLGDGTYQLPNDYCLIHVNGHCIKLATREWTEGKSISFYTKFN